MYDAYKHTRMLSFVLSWKIHTLLPVLLLQEIFCLQLLELRVPTYIALGERTSVSCRWQLDPADVLYSVKWYKDGKEFFRHVPRDYEPKRKFPLPGVKVEDSSNSGSNLTLAPATISTEGRYRCEVSGEGPLFPTVSDHADLIIVVLPEHGPIITGCLPKYNVGDEININCISGKSRPATQLSWFLNGEPAPNIAVTSLRQSHEDGKETTTLNLKLTLTDRHFRKGGLKLKCLATLGSIYWRSYEESVMNDRTKAYEVVNILSFRNNQLIQSSSSNNPRNLHAYDKLQLFILFLYIIMNGTIKLNI